MNKILLLSILLILATKESYQIKTNDGIETADKKRDTEKKPPQSSTDGSVTRNGADETSPQATEDGSITTNGADDNQPQSPAVDSTKPAGSKRKRRRRGKGKRRQDQSTNDNQPGDGTVLSGPVEDGSITTNGEGDNHPQSTEDGPITINGADDTSPQATEDGSIKTNGADDSQPQSPAVESARSAGSKRKRSRHGKGKRRKDPSGNDNEPGDETVLNGPVEDGSITTNGAEENHPQSTEDGPITINGVGENHPQSTGDGTITINGVGDKHPQSPEIDSTKPGTDELRKDQHAEDNQPGADTVPNGAVEEDDDDFSDIDDFDFGLDDLDEESDVNIEANEIPPKDWILILENYKEIIEEKKKPEDSDKIHEIDELNSLENELVAEKKLDFDDTEMEKKKRCAELEYKILCYIRDLNDEDQTYVLDVDKDGIADFNLFSDADPK